MDRQQILLAKALQAAEVPLTVATADDCLILQKATYLLQCAGVRLGFRFRWYMRGPYSPETIAAALGVIREGQSAHAELQGWKLDDASKQRIDRLNSLFSKGDGKAEQTRHLELLGSVLFLINTNQVKAKDAEETFSILRRYSKKYDASDVRKAVKELRKYGLFKSPSFGRRQQPHPRQHCPDGSARGT